LPAVTITKPVGLATTCRADEPTSRRASLVAISILLCLAVTLWRGSQPARGAVLLAQPQGSEAPEGVAAPPALVTELRAVLGLAIQRFEAKDLQGVLAYVSDQYRTGPFTKPVVRQQLIGLYSVYDRVRAQVRIDDVRLVGDHAWVYSTGEIVGRLPLVGTWVQFLAWQRELEVARREAGRWRLFGYQQ
jgi:hypothetical protein